jgi:hypothetical protein
LSIRFFASSLRKHSPPPSRPPAHRARLILALATLATLAMVAGLLPVAPALAQGTPPPVAPATPPPAAAPAGTAQPFGAGVEKMRPRDAAPQPPDGKWLKDDQGRLYYVDKLKKGKYLRIDDHTVRTVWGIPIDVVREDDQYFYFKVYKIDPAVRSVNANARKEPTAEELAKIAASYKVEVPESHRLGFTDFGRGLPRSGQWREGFVLADMNGDGKLDVVHGPPRKSLSAPVIFLGDGKGGWRKWQEARFAPFPYDYGDIAVADLNGDGNLDIVLAMHLHGFTALLGDGKGHFMTRWDKGLDFLLPGKGADETNLFSSKAVTTVNWDGDKLPDILAIGEGPRLNLSSTHDGGAPLSAARSYGPVLYRNQGDGSWKRQDEGTSPAQVFGDSVTVGDFNGDGRPDFAVSTNVQGRRDLVYLARADGRWDKTELDVRPQSYVHAVLAVDLNHSGKSDLVVAYLSAEGGKWHSGIDIFHPLADGKWDRRTLAVKDGRDGVTALAAGDLAGDGNVDLVALTGDGDTWVFLADGKGFFTREAAAIPNFNRCPGSRVRVADLDGDGKAEIVASWSGEYSPMYAPDVCRNEGGITAWHVAPPAVASVAPPAGTPPAPAAAAVRPPGSGAPGEGSQH